MSEFLRGSLGGSSPTDVRLVLLGNIGCGKTSTGDTILGEQSATSPGDSRSCQLRKGLSDNRKVTVVEAPRWFWIGGEMEDSVKKETEQVMTLVAPGPHAVLLLVPVNQFTEVGCSPYLPFYWCFSVISSYVTNSIEFVSKLILARFNIIFSP